MDDEYDEMMVENYKKKKLKDMSFHSP